MWGETDLTTLLASLEPLLQPGVYVIASVDGVPKTCDPIVTVREAEGTTLVLGHADVDAAMASLRALVVRVQRALALGA